MGCIPPVLAYVVMFSICRLQTLSHFHNLAAIFLILLITCAFRHLRFGRTLDLVGMAAPECAMLYFSPYQALLGVVVLSAWGGLQLTVLSPERLKRLMIQACATVPFVGASAWISLQYARVEPREYNLYEFSSRAASLGNYLRPLGTGKDAAWLPTVFPGGYLGAGLLLGGLLVTLALVWRVRNRIHFLVIQRPLWIGIGLLALSLIDARELRPFTVWLRFLAYLYPFGWLVWWLRQNPERDRMLHWIFLGASCVLVVGVSAGPMMYFEDHALDPGIWGWYQHLVPGFGSMRELMRFTATGQFLILACVVSVACTMLKRPALVLGLGGVCLLLQLVEMNGAQPKMIRAASIPPMTEIETAFWEKQQGVLVAFPCAPFHENTRWLLRFQHLPELVLMNGYSGRSSDLLDRLMALESGKGTATPQAVQEAFSSGATYVYILKRTVEPARLQQIRKIQPVVYESRSFLVLGKSNP